MHVSESLKEEKKQMDHDETRVAAVVEEEKKEKDDAVTMETELSKRKGEPSKTMEESSAETSEEVRSTPSGKTAAPKKNVKQKKAERMEELNFDVKKLQLKPKEKEKKSGLMFYISLENNRKLEELAKRNDTSKSKLLNDILDQILKDLE